MAENQQQNIDPQQKGPFSPLQTGCAFVMLTNMLIYLGVVLFTFNLLDPSKIDASYLAKRGFTSRPEPKTEQDAAYQQLSQEKREQQQQTQAELIDSSKLGLPQETSPAAELSKMDRRKYTSSRPEEQERPKAALTESLMRSGRNAVQTAPSRLYSVSMFPQATLRQNYSPYQLPAQRNIALERYDILPVELASGISFPEFSLPGFNSVGAYLYTPPNPVPEASRGGLKLSAPSTGAESLYTNGIRKIEKPQPAKDQL